MAYVPSGNKRLFAYGNQLGYVQYGMFMPVHLDEERFKEVIDDVINYERNCVAADLVLQNAMKRYTGIYVLVRVFDGKSNRDSDFYNTWKEYILNLEKFKKINPKARENHQKKILTIRKNSNKEAFLNNCESASIFRACARIK